MILYLEDSAPMRRQTLEFLRKDQFDVTDCFAIDDAKEILADLKQQGQRLDCIITDLNMEDNWLGEYRGESKGCLLSGWVWLRRFVWTDEAYRNVPCIIYSGFITYLKENADYIAHKEEHSIILVEKGEGYECLRSRLRRLLE